MPQALAHAGRGSSCSQAAAERLRDRRRPLQAAEAVGWRHVRERSNPANSCPHQIIACLMGWGCLFHRTTRISAEVLYAWLYVHVCTPSECSARRPRTSTRADRTVPVPQTGHRHPKLDACWQFSGQPFRILQISSSFGASLYYRSPARHSHTRSRRCARPTAAQPHKWS